MKKHIEDIIEIILEDVSCDHQEIDEHPRGPKYDNVTYCLKDEKKVIEKCIEAIPARLIERPEKKEAKISKATQLIQSRCIHRRMGIMTEGGHKFFHCQDCGKPFPEKEI